jgi:hypothetical protein
MRTILLKQNPILQELDSHTNIMGTARILSLGKDATLMRSRTMVLRAAGYDVSEAYSVEKAIALASSDLIDVSVICHTVDRKERQLFISAVRRQRQMLPVIFIRALAYESAPATSIAIDNDPEILLNAVRLATNRKPSSGQLQS